ncbi:16812_t:CDS:2 [Acaulospora colombiana]|uniref:16812_t:CDS:1 n=1 Tax=Acaulospora colombiana TaxID=27376 RepID=A0ACA9KJS9_9GLOM|nr:16812_t:CDS:2 [Acaulospora colombiana]
MDKPNHSYPDEEVNFLVEGKVFSVRKKMLAAASDFFKDMFDYAIPEKGDTTSTIPLPQESVRSFECLLSMIPKESRFFINSDNVLEIFRISDKFMINDMIEKSLSFLEDNSNVDPIVSLSIAERYQRKDLFKESSKLGNPSCTDNM